MNPYSVWEKFWDKMIDEEPKLHVRPIHGFGIFLIPIFCVWPLLNDGFSMRSRVISFTWLVLWTFVSVNLNVGGLSIQIG